MEQFNEAKITNSRMVKKWVSLSSIFAFAARPNISQYNNKRICDENSTFTPKQRAYRKMRNKMAVSSRRKNWRN